jgi:hypothetical protein
MKTTAKRLRFWITLVVVSGSSVIWTLGFFHSPLMRPEMERERLFVKRYVEDNAPDLLAEKVLAEAYWKRYQDVKMDAYYGPKGPMGIYGAGEHYQQHGRREGRIFAPIHTPEDPAFEQQLAEAYWQRYPDVAASNVWGRAGTLGILGPRDYYTYYGRFLGHSWGLIDK